MNPAERKITHIEGLVEAYYQRGEDEIPIERIQVILSAEPEPFDEEE